MLPETTLTFVAVMVPAPVFPEPEGPVNWMVAPDLKPVPARSVIGTVTLFVPVLGVMPVTVGAASLLRHHNSTKTGVHCFANGHP